MSGPRPRSPLGDSPRWVTVHALGVFFGLTGVFLVLGLAAALVASALGHRDAEIPGFVAHVFGAAGVLAQLSLLRQYLRRRPLTRVDRSYVRTAGLVIAGWCLLTAWWAPVVAGAVALWFFLDREVVEAPAR